MKRFISLSIAFISFLHFFGCATTKSLREDVAFTGDFAKYKSVAVQYEPNPAIDQKENPQAFQFVLINQLNKDKVFPKVTPHEEGVATDLIIKIKVLELDSPSALGAMFGGGMANSEVRVTCDFHETQPQRKVASMEAMGNSKLMGRSSVGGIGVTSGKAYRERAFENAGEIVSDYVQKHHSAFKNKAK